MEKFVQKLKTKVKDETAAFMILGAMIITFTIGIGTYEVIKYNSVAANASAQASMDTAPEVNEEAVNTLTVEDEEELKKENEEEFEKLKEEKKIDTSAMNKYYIKVNYGAQVVTVYKQDSNGDYTVPVKAMVCSTGTYTPTSGVYRTLGKGNWWPLMGNVYGQYSTHIMGDILFHSVPYLTKGDKSSLEYWAYDQLGKRVSMGCVRLTVADAKWIYNNCPIGTQVEFYSSSNPGPLGKPSTRKISDAPTDVRGWDPTDPDSDNPWPEYLEEQEKKKDEDKKKPNKDEEKPEKDPSPETGDDPDKNEEQKPEEGDGDETGNEEGGNTSGENPEEGESGEGTGEGDNESSNPEESTDNTIEIDNSVKI